MIRIINRSILKFTHAFRGLYVAFRNDLSVKIEVLGIIPLTAILYYFWPLETYELFAIILSYGLLLLTELINTSLEAALDKLHPVRHDSIRLSKDIAASAVLVSLIILSTILGIIIFNHI